MSPHPEPQGQDRSLADLLRQLADQSNELARKEIALAKAELELKADRIGLGARAFGGGGILALLAAGTLTATVILALAEAMDAWLAALIVTVVYLAAAGVMALVGRRRFQQAMPPAPERAIESSRRDVEEVKRSAKEGIER